MCKSLMFVYIWWLYDIYIGLVLQDLNQLFKDLSYNQNTSLPLTANADIFAVILSS